MKNLLKTVRNSIAAAMTGRTIEQMETEQRRDAVKSAVDDYLARHPDWKPSQQPSPKAKPVTDSKIKTRRIMKTLGAGGFQEYVVSPELLERARAKCREVVASDPVRYSHIIESAPLRA
ncbi:hypothetical protein [Rahnella inusitata]|uniref:hypothetical protein n=1 Tax=Rahnella inusitata TaxID=58169 RepID=UPI0039BDAC65